MTFRRIAVSFALTLALSAEGALAQSLGTFRWQLLPFGSILNLEVTQQGPIFLLNGSEVQCSNPSLPVWGVAVPQANGDIFIGLTSITEQGNGLHTRAFLNTSDFSGGWRDNANSTGTLLFNPPDPCPSGPRVGPIVPDAAVEEWAGTGHGGDVMQALIAELASMRKRLDELEAKKQ